LSFLECLFIEEEEELPLELEEDEDDEVISGGSPLSPSNFLVVPDGLLSSLAFF
jgi:hypothetical protein